jgi:hypothetical protein
MDDREASFDDIITDDKKSHPNCNYSYYSQRQCRSINGDSVCELAKKISRMCPGERPVEIFSKTSRDDSSGLVPHDIFGGNEDFDFPIPKIADPFSMLEKFMRGIDGLSPDKRSSDRSTTPLDPPHRSYGDRPGAGSENPRRTIDGHVSGPIEKI